MSAIGDLVATLGCNIAPFQNSLNSATGIATRSAGAIRSALSTFTPMLAPAALVGSFGRLASQMDDLVDNADRMNASIEGLQRLQIIAEQSGAGVEVINKGLGEMQIRIAQAFLDPAKATIFEKLKLDVVELRGMKSDEVFVRMAEAITRTGNSMERLRIETELFGKAGKQIDLVLREVAKGGPQNVIPEQTVKDLAAVGGVMEKIWQGTKVFGAEVAAEGTVGLYRENQSFWLAVGANLTSLWQGNANKVHDYQFLIEEMGRTEEQIARSTALREHLEALGEQGELTRQALEKLTEPMQTLLDKQIGKVEDPTKDMRDALAKAERIQGLLPKFFADQLSPQIESLRNQLAIFDAMKETAEVAALIGGQNQEAITRWQTLNSAVVAAQTPLEQYAAALQHVDELVNVFGLDSVTAMRMAAKAAEELDRATGGPEKLREEMAEWEKLGTAAAEVMRKFNPELEFAHRAAGLQRMFEEGLIGRGTLEKALLDAAGQVFPGEPKRGGLLAAQGRGPVLAERGTDIAWRTIMDAISSYGGDEGEKAAVATAENTKRAATYLENIAGRDPDEGAMGID